MTNASNLIGLVLMVAMVTACDPQTLDPGVKTNSSLSFDGANAQSDIARKAHGARLSDVLGCTGCHRPDFAGGPFNEGWIAPNISLMTAEYDHDALDQAIRHGIALDGRKIRMMPTEMYRSLSDEDMQALSTYLLALEPSGEVQPAFEPFASDLAIWALDGYTDGFTLGLQWASSPGPVNVGENHARGRYLAMNLCTECHNNQLQGYPNFTPDLTLIAAYSDAELQTLLHEGKGNVRDQLGLMSLVSPARFPYLTDREYADLTAYLRARSAALIEP